jgi:hypothetical protein
MEGMEVARHWQSLDLGYFTAVLLQLATQDTGLHCHIIISFLKFIMLLTTENIELTTTVISSPPVEACTEIDDRSTSSRPWNTDSENVIAGQTLAPADGGPAAWRSLAAAFVSEALLWGMSCLSYRPLY